MNISKKQLKAEVFCIVSHIKGTFTTDDVRLELIKINRKMRTSNQRIQNYIRQTGMYKCIRHVWYKKDNLTREELEK